MAYLFWAFVVVWVGVFYYLSLIARRSRALEQQVSDLLARTAEGSRSQGSPAGRHPQAP